MTTQQDSVDVEWLRAALELTVGQLTAIREANDPDDPDSYRCDDREGCLDWTHAAAAEAEKAGLAALSLPITQRDEQGSSGTFACPICGDDNPHYHTPAVVHAYQSKRSRS